MKQNLGKFTFILMLLGSWVQAEDFKYAFHVDNLHPYVKEAVVVTLELEQRNPNIVLLFNFDLKKSENYSFQRLNMEETDSHPAQGLHHAKVKYTYLVYPLVSGEIEINSTFLKKVTSNDSVAYSFSGDRDNVKGIVTKDHKIKLNPTVLYVKALPKGTQLVGNFLLDYSLKQHKAEAFEPISFQATLKGKGYPPILSLLPKDVNFTVFTDKPLIDSKSDTQGTYSTVRYAMAFSHSECFSLENIQLNAFNPETQKSYLLKIPKQDFDITEVPKSSLLDKVDNPKAVKNDWLWLKSWLKYLLVFMAGYLAALLWVKKKKLTKRVPVRPEHLLMLKIHSASDTKTLLQVLLANDSHLFDTCIESLENSLYGNAKIKLSDVKRKAKKILTDTI